MISQIVATAQWVVAISFSWTENRSRLLAWLISYTFWLTDSAAQMHCPSPPPSADDIDCRCCLSSVARLPCVPHPLNGRCRSMAASQSKLSSIAAVDGIDVSSCFITWIGLIWSACVVTMRARSPLPRFVKPSRISRSSAVIASSVRSLGGSTRQTAGPVTLLTHAITSSLHKPCASSSSKRNSTPSNRHKHV